MEFLYFKTKEDVLSILPNIVRNDMNLSESAKIVFGILLRYFDAYHNEIKENGFWAIIIDDHFVDMIRYTFEKIKFECNYEINLEALFSIIIELMKAKLIMVRNDAKSFENRFTSYFIPMLLPNL